jgi:cell division protein FtsZ
MFVKPEIERFAKIRVIGVGGAGCNVLNTLIDTQQISGVEFIAVNTDAQALSINKAFVKIPIGQELTGGLGSGANPEVGRRAADESVDVLKSNLEESDMVFITAGMGGGTGTGAAPVIAAIARELGALTVGVVTKPFLFEGAKRMENAERGTVELKQEVDALITIPNQKLLEISDENLSILDAFKLSDSILSQGVQGISDLIIMPGLINVDFADVKAIMKGAGSALMGIGIGTGESRAQEAAHAAITSPLLDVSIDGATGILFNVIGSTNLTMKEVNDAAKIINASSSPDADIIFGTTIDESMGDQVKITVIATGFDQDAQLRSRINLVTEQIQKETPPEQEKQEDDDEEPKTPKGDVYDIPAFLRGP